MPKDKAKKKRLTAQELHNRLLLEYTHGTVIDYLEWGQSQLAKTRTCTDDKRARAPAEAVKKTATSVTKLSDEGYAVSTKEKVNGTSPSFQKRLAGAQVVKRMPHMQLPKTNRRESYVTQLDEVCRRMEWGKPVWEVEYGDPYGIFWPLMKHSLRVRNRFGTIAIKYDDCCKSSNDTAMCERLARLALEHRFEYEDD